jgi:type IV secretion system protein VirB3
MKAPLQVEKPVVDELTVDPLFVALTRPAMAYGVTYAALLVNVVLTLEAFLLTRHLLSLLIALPLHGLAWMLCSVEPRFLELVGAWGRTRASGWQALSVWGAQPYGALPVDMPKAGSGRRAGSRRWIGTGGVGAAGVTVRGSLAG